MENKFFIFILFVFSLLNVSAQQKNTTAMISDVQIKNNWIIVFGNDGKIISQMPQSKNEVVGITGHFFVVVNNG